MNNKLLYSIVLATGCAAAPTTAPKPQAYDSQPVVAHTPETPIFIGTAPEQRWYDPSDYETDESWRAFTEFYFQAHRFSIAYHALIGPADCASLLGDDAPLDDYQRLVTAKKNLRDHFFEAWTFSEGTMQRYDSREVFRLESLARNDPVGLGLSTPRRMQTLYERTMKSHQEYLAKRPGIKANSSSFSREQ